MTSSEQEQYRRLFAVIRQNAPRTGTVVRAQYVASGVVRTGTDQVDVLVFVNQRTTNHQHPKVPVVYKSQVTVTMARSAASGSSTACTPPATAPEAAAAAGPESTEPGRCA